MSVEYHFRTRDEASAAAATRIAGLLDCALNAQSAASLVVSGGSTPVVCFEQLAHSDLEWERVHVLMSDERWVAPTADSSNEKLVRSTLLTDAAAAARLLPVFQPEMSIETRCQMLDKEVDSIPQPFACTLLGMGEDGHFASLFPDAANLEAGLDLDTQSSWLAIDTEASPLPRVSMTLAALLRSREIVLLIFGENKRKVLDSARESIDRYPVSQLLAQQITPVRIFWAP
ncbi:MAG: 6-phosphogluconolactonase [Gammaproteobacteria bacterium]|nr:6-phosphogluconolactonase [Gammaproteobacteria bacterium]